MGPSGSARRTWDGDGDANVLSASADNYKAAWYEDLGRRANGDANGDGLVDDNDQSLLLANCTSPPGERQYGEQAGLGSHWLSTSPKHWAKLAPACARWTSRTQSSRPAIPPRTRTSSRPWHRRSAQMTALNVWAAACIGWLASSWLGRGLRSTALIDGQRGRGQKGSALQAPGLPVFSFAFRTFQHPPDRMRAEACEDARYPRRALRNEPSRSPRKEARKTAAVMAGGTTTAAKRR